MSISSFPSSAGPAEPEVAASINAHLDVLNAAGGIGGHPVKLVMCYDHDDPNTARTCANQAVSDPKIVATVDVYSENDNVIDPIMEDAGMPQIGIDPQGPADTNCDVCFAFDGGGYSDTIGIAVLLHVYDHVNKIDLEIPPVPDAQATLGVVKDVFLKLYPTASVHEQFVSFTVADYAPYVAATEGYQGTALYTGGSQQAAWLKEASSLGIHMDYGIIGSGLSPQSISQIGALLNGAVVSSDTAPPDSNVPGAALYRSEVAKYAPGTAIDQNGLYGWMSAKFFGDTATTIKGSITRASLLAALRNVNDYTGFEGLIPPYTTTKPFNCGGCGVGPDLYNVDLLPARFENGKVTLISSGYLDPYTGQVTNG